MPHPVWPHLHHERARGRMVWYVRIGHGPRTRIRAAWGSLEFLAEYRAAATSAPAREPAKPSTGTLSWLWGRYRETAAWTRLSSATRRQRENIMRGVLETAGSAPFSKIDRKAIVAGRDRRSATPAMARHFVDTMRGMFRWALDAEMIEVDPTRDVHAPKPKTNGHHTWTVEELRAFIGQWPLGTRERLAFDLILFTGLRRGDAVRLGRQHVGKDGRIRIRTEKTGEPVAITILPMLAASLEAGPCGDLAFIASTDGKPMTKESFGNWFGSACRQTGVKGTAHGLRKSLATLATDEGGATEAELESLFGWRGGGMASLYTRNKNRDRLSGQLSERLGERLANVLFPHTVGELPHVEITQGKSRR